MFALPFKSCPRTFELFLPEESKKNFSGAPGGGDDIILSV